MKRIVKGNRVDFEEARRVLSGKKDFRGKGTFRGSLIPVLTGNFWERRGRLKNCYSTNRVNISTACNRLLTNQKNYCCNKDHNKGKNSNKNRFYNKDFDKEIKVNSDSFNQHQFFNGRVFSLSNSKELAINFKLNSNKSTDDVKIKSESKKESKSLRLNRRSLSQNPSNTTTNIKASFIKVINPNNSTNSNDKNIK